ncbi:MAG: Gx transporter family protein [Oscillospiraceae bacterium]
MKTKKLVSLALCTAMALTIYIIEAQIPPLVAIPGIKMGLSNIVTLFALVFLISKEATIILVLRVTLGSIFAGQALSFMYSLSGGLTCLLIEVLALKFLKSPQIWAVSVLGAITHNITQISVAYLITQSVAVFWYIPFLLISAIITGAFTGIIIDFINKNHRSTIEKLLR